MKKLLVALLIAGSGVVPGGVASADHCIDPFNEDFPDPNCKWTCEDLIAIEMPADEECDGDSILIRIIQS